VEPRRLSPSDEFILRYLARREPLKMEQKPYHKAPPVPPSLRSIILAERAERLRLKAKTPRTFVKIKHHSRSLYEPFITNARQTIYMLLYLWAEWEVDINGEKIYWLFFPDIIPILRWCAQEHQCNYYAPGTLTRIVGSLYNDGLINKVDAPNPYSNPNHPHTKARRSLYFVPPPGLLRDEYEIEELLIKLQIPQTAKYISNIKGRRMTGYNAPRPYRGTSVPATDIRIGKLPPATDIQRILRGNTRWAALPITGPLGDGSKEIKSKDWF
jgi:hypothetical protein